MNLNNSLIIKGFISSTLLFSILVLESNDSEANINKEPKITYIYTQYEVKSKNIKTKDYYVSSEVEKILKNKKNDNNKSIKNDNKSTNIDNKSIKNDGKSTDVDNKSIENDDKSTNIDNKPNNKKLKVLPETGIK